MATHDYVISNGTGSAVRSDINNVLAAIVSNNSASSEPSTKYAYQFWADTNTSILKIRNSANNAWINLFTLAGGIDVDAASNFNEDVTFTGASYNLVWDKSDNALEFADNALAVFGTGNDLTIKHDGSNSKITESGTGILAIGGSEVHIEAADHGETLAKFIDDGSVELFFDNELKLQTTASGLQVKDTSAVTTWVGLESSGGTCGYLVGQSNAGNGSDKAVAFYNAAGNETLLRGITDGAFEAYFDNSKKLQTESYGCQVFGEFFIGDGNGSDASDHIRLGNGGDLKIYFDGSNSYIKGNGASCGSIIIDNSADADQNIELKAGQDVYLKVSDGTEVGLRCERGGKTYAYFDNSVKWRTQSWGAQLTGNFLPDGNDNYNLGASGERWSTVYSVNSLNTSDRNEKNTIIKSDLGLDFINKLKPVSYKWNKDDGKTHYGLIAQDIEETVLDEGKAITDVGFIDKPSQGQMSLAYNELFSPLIKAIQELSAKVEALESA